MITVALKKRQSTLASSTSNGTDSVSMESLNGHSVGHHAGSTSGVASGGAGTTTHLLGYEPLAGEDCDLSYDTIQPSASNATATAATKIKYKIV